MHLNGKNICGARTRNGGKCQNPPMDNGRCRMHGGKSKRGIESGSYKHGLYSKYAGDDLKSILDELANQSGDDLINPENEIRLMQALIISARALKQDVSDLRDLDTISKIIDRLITAKQRSQAIMIERQRLIPASDVERFLTWMESVLIDRIGEQQGYEIIDQMKTFKLSQN